MGRLFNVLIETYNHNLYKYNLSGDKLFNPNINNLKDLRRDPGDIKKWQNMINELISDNYDLINFHESKHTIKIKLPSDDQKNYLSQLEEKITDEIELSIIYEPSQEILSSERIREKLQDNTLCTDLKKDVLETRLIKISSHTLEDKEEGLQTLFLILGVLKWYEKDSSSNKKQILSPLILIPIDIVKRDDSDYFFHVNGKSFAVNTSLFKRLKEEYLLEFPEFREEITYDQYCLSFQKIFGIIKEVILRTHDDWEIRTSVYIEHFSKKYSKFEEWKIKLLNLADNNYDLLNFRESNKKIIKLLIPDDSGLDYIASIEDSLSEGKNLILTNASEKETISSDIIQANLKEKTLLVTSNKKDFGIRLLDIFNQNQVSNEESGVSTLFLALGMLERYHSNSPDKPILSPLIFIPLEIVREGLSDYRIYRGDDEARVNVTLINKLKEDYGLEFPLIEDNLPTDEHGIDIRLILDHFMEVISKYDSSWRIKNSAYIGHFSYSKYLMWKDLEDLDLDTLIKKHKLFAKLVDPEHRQYNGGYTFPKDDLLDEQYHPGDILCPVSADSSQLAAIIAAKEGNNFVLHGPPGTGKSQTITNIIAQCLAEDRTVLFVSEKRVALDVVYNRLKECGLSPFCLELHSNKSSKRKVLDQFDEILSFTYLNENIPQYWRERCNELEKVRRELNSYVKAVHLKRSTGESYYHGISILSKNRNTEYIQLSWPFYSDFDKQDLDLRREYVGSLVNTLKYMGNPICNPWNPSRISECNPQYKNSVNGILHELKEVSDKFSKISKSGFNLIFKGCCDTRNVTLRNFIRIINIINKSDLKISKKLLIYPDFESDEEKFKNLISLGRERNYLKDKILLKYSPELLDINVEELSTLISLGGFFNFKRVKTILKPFALNQPGKNGEVASDIKALIRLKEIFMVMGENEGEVSSLFADNWNYGESDWSKTERCITITKQLRKIILSISNDDNNYDKISENLDNLLNNLCRDTETSKKLRRGFINIAILHQQTQKIIENFLSILKMSNIGISEDDEIFCYLKTLESKIELWMDNIPKLNTWAQYQKIRRDCIETGLEGLINAVESKNIPSEDIIDLFNRSYYQWWVDNIRSDDQSIKNYFKPDHEATIHRLKQIDNEYQALTREQIVTKLYSRLSDWDLTKNNEKEILDKQIKRKRNNISVRCLFRNIPAILPILKPCILMSPISVAQYLSSEDMFDVVIFDEASQIPIWDAIGSIVRGNQVIIVGDPKQMPPSNYYQRMAIGEDGVKNLFENLENVLDDCIVSGIPEMHLNWHYRSRHESLIAFSNYWFYKNALRTFPSPHTNSAVTLRKVSGIYDGGVRGSHTNKIEAELVVTEIIKRLSDPQSSGDSIGVVTFNQPQRDLIDDLLEEAKHEDPELLLLLNKKPGDYLFIKNLESVQGDERDVIIFSIGYGPDIHGNVSLQFGPLNNEGGERRLNVAITRARKEIVVFSSLYPEHMNIAGVQGKGVKLLKSFLEYAEHGEICENGSGITGDYESPFEEEVGTIIQNMGYEIRPQVGCAGYRIDIGIVDPDYPGRYLLGVECDGARYHSFKTARDRDRLREEVLTGLGWKIYRIWSTDWWENQKDEIAWLEMAINDAKKFRRDKFGKILMMKDKIGSS